MLRSANKVRNLIDTSSIHYNPTGPGDYTIPSVFGELPPPRQSEKAIRFEHALKKPPSYSIGARFNDKRVYVNNLEACHSLETPPLGTYDPVNVVNPSLEDKIRLKLLRAQMSKPYLNQSGKIGLSSSKGLHLMHELNASTSDPTTDAQFLKPQDSMSKLLQNDDSV